MRIIARKCIVRIGKCRCGCSTIRYTVPISFDSAGHGHFALIACDKVADCRCRAVCAAVIKERRIAPCQLRRSRAHDHIAGDLLTVFVDALNGVAVCACLLDRIDLSQAVTLECNGVVSALRQHGAFVRDTEADRCPVVFFALCTADNSISDIRSVGAVVPRLIVCKKLCLKCISIRIAAQQCIQQILDRRICVVRVIRIVLRIDQAVMKELRRNLEIVHAAAVLDCLLNRINGRMNITPPGTPSALTHLAAVNIGDIQ